MHHENTVLTKDRIELFRNECLLRASQGRNHSLRSPGPYPATGTVTHTPGLPHSEAASYDQYSTARSSYSPTQLLRRQVSDLPDTCSMVQVLKAYIGWLCFALLKKELGEGCGRRGQYKYDHLPLGVPPCSLARTTIIKPRWNTSGLSRAIPTSQITNGSREATPFPLVLSHHRPVLTEWALGDRTSPTNVQSPIRALPFFCCQQPYVLPQEGSSDPTRVPAILFSFVNDSNLRIPPPDRGSGSTGWFRQPTNLPYNLFPRPDLAVSPIQALPSTMLLPGVAVNANAHISEYQRSNREKPAFGSPPEEPSFPLDCTESGSAGTQDAAPWFVNRASTSGGGGYRGQPKAMNRPVMTDPRLPYSNDLSGSGPHSPTGTVPHTSGLPHSEAASYDQYSAARSSYSPTQLLGTPSSSRQMEGGNDVSRRPVPPQPHNLSDESGGRWENPWGRRTFILLGFRTSQGEPNAVEGSEDREKLRTELKVLPAVRPRIRENAANSRRSQHRSVQWPISGNWNKPNCLQLAANSASIRGPTRLVPVPQTWYECPQKQDWEDTAPVEFGNLKLTDAADQAYPHLQGRNEKVLNYRGFGSAVTCRLNFSGRVIGTSKVLTTDNKQPRDFITKKLAFEVSKFVCEHIEIIQNEPGRANITFQNLVLVSFVRVASASWQPVLCYEVPVSYPNGSG